MFYLMFLFLLKKLLHFLTLDLFLFINTYSVHLAVKPVRVPAPHSDTGISISYSNKGVQVVTGPACCRNDLTLFTEQQENIYNGLQLQRSRFMSRCDGLLTVGFGPGMLLFVCVGKMVNLALEMTEDIPITTSWFHKGSGVQHIVAKCFTGQEKQEWKQGTLICLVSKTCQLLRNLFFLKGWNLHCFWKKGGSWYHMFRPLYQILLLRNVLMFPSLESPAMKNTYHRAQKSRRSRFLKKFWFFQKIV